MGFILKKLSTIIFKKLLLSNTVLTSTTKELVLKELASKNVSISKSLKKTSFKTLTASSLSLVQVVSDFVFKKLFANAFVATSKGYGFRELSTTAESTPVVPPITGLDSEDFDLRWLGLKTGTYAITVTTIATGLKLAESEHSKSVDYKVE